MMRFPVIGTLLVPPLISTVCVGIVRQGYGPTDDDGVDHCVASCHIGTD